MFNPFLFMFCVQCHLEAVPVRITMTNGSYTMPCLITGISPWHLQIRYFLQNSNTFVTAVLDAAGITDVMVFTEVAQLIEQGAVV